MTATQRKILEVIARHGHIDVVTLEAQCGIDARHRGGFRSSLQPLFERGALDCDHETTWLTPIGEELLRLRHNHP